MKCDIIGCTKELSVINPMKSREDGNVIQNLFSSRPYIICNDCITKLGLK